MWIHQYRQRYVLTEKGRDLLTVNVRYKCRFCHRTITVTPHGVHAHLVCSSDLVVSVIESYITFGHTLESFCISRQHQVELFRKYEGREREYKDFFLDVADRLALLRSLPAYCLIPHQGYMPKARGSPPTDSRVTRVHQRSYLDVYVKPP